MFRSIGWAKRTGTQAMQGVHCAPGTNIWFVCTGTWKDNKIKKEITFKRLFCGFVSSKPEGRKTVIGTYIIEYWMQNQLFFKKKVQFLCVFFSPCLLFWLFVVKNFNIYSNSECGDQQDQFCDQHHHPCSLSCQDSRRTSPQVLQ